MPALALCIAGTSPDLLDDRGMGDREQELRRGSGELGHLLRRNDPGSLIARGPERLA
jgi:hypothetical protein